MVLIKNYPFNTGAIIKAIRYLKNIFLKNVKKIFYYGRVLAFRPAWAETAGRVLGGFFFLFFGRAGTCFRFEKPGRGPVWGRVLGTALFN